MWQDWMLAAKNVSCTGLYLLFNFFHAFGRGTFGAAGGIPSSIASKRIASAAIRSRPFWRAILRELQSGGRWLEDILMTTWLLRPSHDGCSHCCNLRWFKIEPPFFQSPAIVGSTVACYLEGQDSWPEGAWRAVQLRQATGAWQSRACGVLPATCALLSSRPELSCANSGAALVRRGCRERWCFKPWRTCEIAVAWRLRAGGRLKPHFGHLIQQD